MAVSFSCKCDERKKPVAERNWTVIQYRSHHSAFAGYHYTISDYSTVRCCSCHSVGRTKAGYVDDLHAAGKTGWEGKGDAK